MFGGVGTRIDNLETELVDLETQISRLRARQVEILTSLEDFQVYLTDGDRGMEDWVASRLDVSRQTSHRLITVAHASDPWHLQASVGWSVGVGSGGVPGETGFHRRFS
jgi:hypothetical protein